MSMFDYCFILIVLILCYWIFQLKKEIERVSDESAHKPPETPSLTIQDMKMLQSSLAELVQDVEQYTESQLQRMSVQSQTIQVLCQRLETKMKEIEEPPAPIPQMSSTRVVPLSPKQNFSKHKDRDKIIELYKKGWPEEKIAEELRITKGEVQLIVNLA